MRDFAHHYLLGYHFLVLEISYSQDATMDINTKYVKDAVLCKDMPFRGCKTKI